MTVTANGFGPLKQSVTVNENQNNFFTLSVGPPIRDKLDFLRPGWERRFARAFQYQYELAEQPGTVLADFLIGDETAFPPETVTRPIPNPQRYLQKHTLTLKLVELIPDRLALFKRGSDYLKKHPEAAAGEELSEIVCDDKPLITCLTRGGSWWQRAAMGTTINASVGQRPDVIDNIIISATSFDKKFQFTGGFVDPAKLFPSASRWKSTLDDVQKVNSALALIEAVSDAKSRPWKQPWAAIIPKIEFKMIAEFDFFEVQRSTETSTVSGACFKWDLTRAISDTKNRNRRRRDRGGAVRTKEYLGTRKTACMGEAVYASSGS